MRKELAIYTQENIQETGILFDESITISTNIIRSVKMPESTLVSCLFFELMELSDTEAFTVTRIFSNVLHRHVFDDNFFLLKVGFHLIAKRNDGASMLGRNAEMQG